LRTPSDLVLTVVAEMTSLASRRTTRRLLAVEALSPTTANITPATAPAPEDIG
jgi:hypothetical protein